MVVVVAAVVLLEAEIVVVESADEDELGRYRVISMPANTSTKNTIMITLVQRLNTASSVRARPFSINASAAPLIAPRFA